MGNVALVTGAYGFLGRHVARALSMGGTYVIGIGHGSWEQKEWCSWGLSEWYKADVTLQSLNTYAGVADMVYHCAGSGSVAFSMSHPHLDWQRSVNSTIDVLEYIRISQPNASLVIPSSAGVYGVAACMPISTNAELKPVSPYGLGKKVVEEICCSYSRHFGVRTALVRLFSVYGVGIRKQLLWDACRKLTNGDVRFSGTGMETRDWLHVEDAAELMILASKHACDRCPIVNGGEGKAVSIHEVITLIASRLNSSLAPIFTGEVRDGDPTHYQADISDSIEWGWSPKYDRETEMRSYVDWFVGGAK
jgi:UDP-glucose 4-epimerase